MVLQRKEQEKTARVGEDVGKGGPRAWLVELQIGAAIKQFFLKKVNTLTL